MPEPRSFNPQEALKEAEKAAAEILDAGISHVNYMRVMGPAVRCAQEQVLQPGNATIFPKNFEDMALTASKLAIDVPPDHQQAKKIKHDAFGLASRMVKMGYSSFQPVVNQVGIETKFQNNG